MSARPTGVVFASFDDRAMFRRYLGEIPDGTSDAQVIRACKIIKEAIRNQAMATITASEVPS